MFRIFKTSVETGEEITNKVVAGSISVEKIFCEGQVSFAQVSASQLKLTTTEDLNLTNETLFVTNADGEAFGAWTVTYSAKVQNSPNVNITAYDVLKKFDKDVSVFYNSLPASASLYAVLAAFCQYCGTYINIGQIQSPNKTLVLHKTIAPTKLNGLDLLGKFGEVLGVWFAPATATTIKAIKLKGVTAYEVTSTYGAHGYSGKDYDTYPIQRVSIKTEEDDVGVTVGEGGSVYTVTGNYLLYGRDDLETVANNILGQISGVSVRPCEIVTPFTKAAAEAHIWTYDGHFIPCMNKTIAETITVKCEGNQYLEEPDDTETEMQIIKGQSNVIKNDVNGLKQRVTTIEGDYVTSADIEVISGEISAEVTETVEGEIAGTYVKNEDGISTQGTKWVLKPTDFTISSVKNGSATEVLKVTADGLTVNGSGTFTGTLSAGTVSGGNVNGATVEGGKIHGATIISPAAGEEVEQAKWHRTQVDNGVVGVFDKDEDDNTTLRSAVLVNNQLCLHEGTTDYTTDANGAITNVHANAEVAVFGKNSFCDILNATQELRENNTALSNKYLGINAKATDAAHADNADNATNATNATNWGGVMQGSGGEKTVLNSDSLSAKDANDNASTLHLNYAGGEVKVGAGGSANLSVTGTISEGGTSLVDKYSPLSHLHTKSQITDFPTNISAFSNDSGYITSTETSANANMLNGNTRVLNCVSSGGGAYFYLGTLENVSDGNFCTFSLRGTIGAWTWGNCIFDISISNRGGWRVNGFHSGNSAGGYIGIDNSNRIILYMPVWGVANIEVSKTQGTLGDGSTTSVSAWSVQNVFDKLNPFLEVSTVNLTSDGKCYLKKMGSQVTLFFNYVTLTTSEDCLFHNAIPSAYRPSSTVYNNIACSNRGKIVSINVNSSGDINGQYYEDNDWCDIDGTGNNWKLSGQITWYV